MQIHKQVFNNLFGNRRITITRFRNFCRFALNALTQANDDGRYNDAIAQVQTVLNTINAELNDVDSGLTEQVNSTLEITKYIQAFGKYMQTAAGAIAFSLGGKDTPAYRAFYPYKPEEYYRATKGNMPDLTARVATAAKKYADQLGERLTADLQGFSIDFHKLVNNQEMQMTSVNQDRKGRNDAFAQGQWTLTGIVHDVASLNNGNPQETEKLFPFAMLYPQKKSNIRTFTGELTVSESREVLNCFLTTDVSLTVQNTVVNADVMVWLAASPKADAPATAVVVKANTNSTLKAGDLGDLKNPFLLIKNVSSMNEASYKIDITGLKKEPKTPKPAVKEEKPAAAPDALHVAS